MTTIELRPVSIGVKKIKIRRTPPSLNARMHWTVRANWTKAAEYAIEQLKA